MKLNEKEDLFLWVLLFGLFSSISVQKAVRALARKRSGDGRLPRN